MRSKSQAAWETAARCAALAQEADNSEEREHYVRLHDAWTTLAKRCEDFNVPDVTEKSGKGAIGDNNIGKATPLAPAAPTRPR